MVHAIAKTLNMKLDCDVHNIGYDPLETRNPLKCSRNEKQATSTAFEVVKPF